MGWAREFPKISAISAETDRTKMFPLRAFGEFDFFMRGLYERYTVARQWPNISLANERNNKSSEKQILFYLDE